MTGNFYIEPVLAVIPLHLILTVYLRRVYSHSETFNKKFLNLCYVVMGGLVTDALYIAVINNGAKFAAVLTLLAVYLRQTVFVLVCLFFTEYAVHGEDNGTDIFFKRIGYVLTGIFFYFQTVMYFTGVNAHLEDGAYVNGSSMNLFFYVFPQLYVFLSLCGIFIKRRSMEPYRFKILLPVITVSSAAFVLLRFLFPRLLPDMICASCVMYFLLLSLESPSYSHLEKVTKELGEAQETARQAEAEAKKADMDMSEFLATTSHEIRTPLTTILGMNEIILRKYESGPVYEHARDIESAGNTLVHIINDILDFSKIESGELELAIREYHLGQVLRDVDNMIRVRAAQKGLGFISRTDHSLPDGLIGDRIRIQQIMVNLLNNGVKYTREGHVKLAVSGKRGNDPSSITLCIEVSDTGIGIRDEDMDKLFKNFTRIDPAKTHSIEGTGLGLAITGRLIELMNGTVDVHSVYGQGTTFTVYIPQRVTGTATLRDFEEADTHRAAERKRAFTAPGKRVLIVDDNQMNRIVLQALLEETKMDTDQAAGGEEALQKCADTYYDLILMDYMMPHMDGKETLKKLRESDSSASRNSKVVVCTANAVVGVRAELLQAGFDDFLSKPVNSDDLRDILERYIPA